MCAVYTLPPGEKGQFSVVPDGVYHMQVQSPKVAYARGSGAPTIECYLGALDGAYAGERVYHQYSLTAESLWRIRDDLRTLGRLPRERYPVNQPVQLEDTEMVRLLDGAIGYASIFTDSFKGTPRSKLASDGFLSPEELQQRGIAVAPATAPAAPAAPAPPVQPSMAPPPGMPEAREPF